MKRKGKPATPYGNIKGNEVAVGIEMANASGEMKFSNPMRNGGDAKKSKSKPGGKRKDHSRKYPTLLATRQSDFRQCLMAGRGSMTAKEMLTMSSTTPVSHPGKSLQVEEKAFEGNFLFANWLCTSAGRRRE